jgi:hypothetical protein
VLAAQSDRSRSRILGVWGAERRDLFELLNQDVEALYF